MKKTKNSCVISCVQLLFLFQYFCGCLLKNVSGNILMSDYV